MTQGGAAGFVLETLEADLSLVFVPSLSPECKNIVHKSPFVRRDAGLALLRELKPKLSCVGGRAEPLQDCT